MRRFLSCAAIAALVTATSLPSFLGSLPAWAAQVSPALEAAGADGPCDILALSLEDLKSLPLTLVQARRLQAAARSACGDSAAAGGAPLPMKTFGCIHSEPFSITTGEFVVCEYNTTVPAAITHMQFTFTGDAADVYFRAYVDEEALPGGAPGVEVQMEQGMFAVETPQSPDPSAKRIVAPWGTERMGRGSLLGGRYFNFRVPFTSRVRLVVIGNPANASAAAALPGCFCIIRGSEGAAATAGGVALPASARLRVSPVWAGAVDKFAHLHALNASGGPGVLAMWILFVYDSTMGLTYLEGCQRAWLDGRLVQVGDGEDFFDSGYYFDAGMYTFPQAGLLEKGDASTLAYRIFDSDPIVWDESVVLTWRNCETYPKCVDAGNTPPPDPTHWVNVSSFVWYYTW